MDYKTTVNLPKTAFPMRASLPKREPLLYDAWEKEDIYARLQEQQEGLPEFLLHDGPPFANGDAHMGHALNMTLKDIVLKSRNMSGFSVPFIPGWDCHGLPIEHKVMKDLEASKKKGKKDKKDTTSTSGEAVEMDAVEIRERCEAEARKYIEIQKAQFKRLGVFGEWDDPYLTLNPSYEADVLRVIAKLVEKGLVYQALRPVLWSTGCQTALAEAEVDYMDRVDPSIYVRFSVTDEDSLKKLGLKKGDKASLLIWTTTPWTLPANMGVAVHESMNYVLAEVGDEKVICATSRKEAIEKVAVDSGEDAVILKEVSKLKGSDLEGLKYDHPFADRGGVIHTADFVTEESGTGLVHIAPGHGSDDYQLGKRVGLDVFSPVNDRGCLTEEAGMDAIGLSELTGMYVFKANEPIVQMLAEKDILWAKEDYNHSYPHCWRSKTPIVFRAVTQWFIKVDEFRQEALDAIDEVNWIPDWGENRIRGAVTTRPDWCISRQRTWGVPIPAFYDEKGTAHLDAETVHKFADLAEKEGAGVWFKWDDAKITETLGLPKGYTKGSDTLDVWIESGASHAAVMKRRLSFPADLYLEGSDQHRGWFQSSLCLAIATLGEAPFRNVLTNGFVMDKDGKLSKSKKAAQLMSFVDRFGADILRLWVSSENYRNDVPFSEEIFKHIADAYRSMRNTLRILMGNLNGFDPEKDRVAVEDLHEIDLFVLSHLQEVVEKCQKAYDDYEFHTVYHVINRFCAVELSALYVDVTKDRMYCDAWDGERRRSTQTVMYEVLETLCLLLAPLIPFTAEEAWQFSSATVGNGETDAEGKLLRKSVHLQAFPKAKKVDVPNDDANDDVKGFAERWEKLLELRSKANEKLEALRDAKTIGKSLEAQLTIKGSGFTEEDEALLKELFIVSKVTLESGEDGKELEVIAEKAAGEKCVRCWNYSEHLGTDPMHPELCPRCTSAVGAITIAKDFQV